MSNTLAPTGLHYLLLAQNGRYSEMGSRFRPGGAAHSGGEIVTLFVVLLLVAAAAWLLARLFHLNQWVGRHSSGRLFRELCRAHGLDWRQRSLLRQLARAHRLDQPARLFLEPERFDVARLGPAIQPRAHHMAALRDALFLPPARGNDAPAAA